MGARRVVIEVEIGCQSFDNVFSVGIYEEVGMSQYLKLLIVKKGSGGFLTMRGCNAHPMPSYALAMVSP